jgi:hypothetical protein
MMSLQLTIPLGSLYICMLFKVEKRISLFVCVKKVGVQVDHKFQLMHNVMATNVDHRCVYY